MAIKKYKYGRIPGGKPSKMEDNPSAQKHYAHLIKMGYETEDDFPMAVSMDNYREVYPNPKNRKSLRARDFDDANYPEEAIKEWKMRKYLNAGEIPPTELRKHKKSKPKVKKCSCKKK
jgi:hypothetical protein